MKYVYVHVRVNIAHLILDVNNPVLCFGFEKIKALGIMPNQMIVPVPLAVEFVVILLKL
jgi:hypothetical protein